MSSLGRAEVKQTPAVIVAFLPLPLNLYCTHFVVEEVLPGRAAVRILTPRRNTQWCCIVRQKRLHENSPFRFTFPCYYALKISSNCLDTLVLENLRWLSVSNARYRRRFSWKCEVYLILVQKDQA